jgi:Uroporphyrinogen decarboxylase (URO-D)
MSTNAMTGKQRYISALRGIKPDKIPYFAGNYNSFITYRYGVTVRQYLDEPAHTAELMARFCNEYQFDQFLAGVGYIMYGCGPELGVRWEWPPNNFPAAVEGPFKNPADVDKFEVPTEPRGYFKNYLENIRGVNQALGQHTYVTASILGPFSSSCFLRGVDKVMVDAKMNLDFYNKYMAKAMDLSRFFAREVFKALADPPQAPMFNEVFLIPEMVSPKFYHEHIAPYDREIVSEFKLTDLFANIMGKPNDPMSQKIGRMFYDYLYGTKESLAVIEQVAKAKLPGLPGMVSVSGRGLVQWPKQQVLDFVHKGVDTVVAAGMVPCVSVISVQPNSPESAKDVADKLAALRKFIDGYKL